ncbi:McrC family protein [Natronocalculus amylovorans]|uniref:McrC family protein n=1 Tax=Natronocalculus amylovorans TaxID=2917812 RepID=A0AAE3KCA9_9EURY|nr:McrC family protein [Natronocalculus amylovorans]MCL9817769.1 McrC family protein [Natronocalculus amylovorans]
MVTEEPLREWVPSDPLSLSTQDLEYINQKINRNSDGKKVTKLDVKPYSSERFKITSKRHVGTVSLPSGTVLRIRPKVELELLNLVRFGIGAPPDSYLEKASYEVADDSEFTRLIAYYYSSILQRVLQRGIRPEYVNQNESRKQVRGKINLHRQLQKRGPISTEFECDYSELSYDSTLNQTLVHAAIILTRLHSGDKITHRLNRQITILKDAGVSQRKVPIHSLQTISSQMRLTSTYETALKIANMVIRQTSIENLHAGAGAGATFLLNMDNLFEMVARRAVKAVFDNSKITVTKRNIGYLAKRRSDDQPLGRPMQPDIIAQLNGGSVLVGDVKWKDVSTPSKQDVYQVLSYSTHEHAPGILLYPPSVVPEPRVYQLSNDQELCVLSLNLDKPSYEDFVATITEDVQTAVESLEVF